ncbi:MAG: CopG family transcriptional regulator [Chthoniobacterales bacterium]|nr:CopG family transcriptional regulator [Chthoniobacterales bacterium]
MRLGPHFSLAYCFSQILVIPSGMPTITVKLSRPEFSRLEAVAAASRRSKSEIVREALAAAPGNSTSLLDAMRPYVGKLSGPGDLSSNKARMKGYGASRSR